MNMNINAQYLPSSLILILFINKRTLKLEVIRKQQKNKYKRFIATLFNIATTSQHAVKVHFVLPSDISSYLEKNTITVATHIPY